jgi:hypothetical protein
MVLNPSDDTPTYATATGESESPATAAISFPDPSALSALASPVEAWERRITFGVYATQEKRNDKQTLAVTLQSIPI